MFHDSRGPWLFLGIGLAAILIANTLQGRERQPSGYKGETAHLVAILGETRRVSEAQPFQSGSLTSVIGRSVLDLRRASLAPGAEALVDVFALMGGVEIRVPEGWTVDTRTIPVFGGVHDNRRHAAIDNDNPAVAAPRLVLHGVVMMGGLEIK